MGNAPPATSVQPELRLSYLGPTLGSLPKGVQGAIRSNHIDPVSSEARPSALSAELAEYLFASLGPMDTLPKSPTNLTFEAIHQGTADLPTSIELVHPALSSYVPFFHDRKAEYGPNHAYYEALCHALPTYELITSASARYFRRNGTAVMVVHLPATLAIIAFIESFRVKNKAFLEELHTRLKAKEATEWKLVEGVALSVEDAITRFIDGAFRNVAIQMHYKGGTRDRAGLLHLDHVFSALHMGVTLHGERAVGFVVPSDDPQNDKWPPNEVTLPMRMGDVYVTTPASILHGVSTRDLSESDRSVALQCRTMLDAPSAQFWNAHKAALNGVVAKLLAEMSLTLPSLEEVKIAQDEIAAKWKTLLPEPPQRITLENIADD